MQEQIEANSDEYSDEDKNTPGGGDGQITNKIEKCGDKNLIDIMHRKLEEQITFLQKKPE